MRERFGRSGAEARSRARAQARWLIRDHGVDAEAVIAGKLDRPGNSAIDRYRYRCTVRELRRIRAIEAEQRIATAVVVWKPTPLMQLSAIAARLLGRGRRQRREG